MSQTIIKIGKLPNDGTGDPLRLAFQKVNLNFDDLYPTYIGPVTQLLAGNNIVLNPINGQNVVTITALDQCDYELDVDGGNTSTVELGDMVIDGGEAYTCT